MKPEERAVLESISIHLKEVSSDLAEAVAGLTEQAAAFEQLTDLVRAMTSKLAELYDQQGEQNERINRYILDKAKDDGRIGQLEKFVSEVRKRAANG